MQKRWDIFCKVVDNFGDIGVCWRLAKQLQSEYGLQVRFWVDDWAVAEHFIPALKHNKVVEGVSIHHWHEDADFSQAADVVIEAFAGGLPGEYLTAMQAQKSTWVNLDYLTAEAWVDDFHGKPSPQANGMVRHFYFPGFTEKTGGLLRENNITKNKIPTLNQKNNQHNTELKVSLFCYPHAPIHALLNTIARASLPTLCYVPHSTVLPKVAAYFNRPSLQIGDTVSDGSLSVQVLPFLSQEDYDQLLADCDVNFVRGEDSWVRAIWAEKPFIWQPYFQAENTHLIKLEAFLSKFYGVSDFEVVHQMHHAWLTGDALASKWLNYFSQLDTIADHTRKQVNYFNKQQDLAEKLVFFCKQL